MKIHVEGVIAQLRARISDPERARIAVVLATDLADVQARALLGHSVGRELAHLRSQASSLVATEAEAVRQTLDDLLTQAKEAVIGFVLSAAAGA